MKTLNKLGDEDVVWVILALILKNKENFKNTVSFALLYFLGHFDTYWSIC